MKVKMKVNLGSRDAAKLRVNWAECTEGKVVDVSDESAEALIARGWALPEAVKGDPKPVEMKGK